MSIVKRYMSIATKSSITSKTNSLFNQGASMAGAEVAKLLQDLDNGDKEWNCCIEAKDGTVYINLMADGNTKFLEGKHKGMLLCKRESRGIE